MLNVLTLTSQYPNAEMPSHGIFVEERLRQLRETGAVDNRVIAPVPWFPLPQKVFGDNSAWARVPRREPRFGADIWHPRYLTIPKVSINRRLNRLYRSFRQSTDAMTAEGFQPDILDSHGVFPDGVAAAWVADALDLPLVITIHDTDFDLISKTPGLRQVILAAAETAERIITVCRALKTALTGLGVPSHKITVLRNGVDLDRFQPRDRAAAQQHFGVSGTVLLSAGPLIAHTGHDDVIEALAAFPEATLLIAGAGPEEGRLKTLADDLGMVDRVRFLGAVSDAEWPMLYSATDILVAASGSEGWSNVLLEAMACGTPVVATDIGGTDEVVTAPEAGVLVPEQDAFYIAEGIRQLLDNLPDRIATRRYAEQFGWDDTTAGQLTIFRRLARKT